MYSCCWWPSTSRIIHTTHTQTGNKTSTRLRLRCLNKYTRTESDRRVQHKRGVFCLCVAVCVFVCLCLCIYQLNTKVFACVQWFCLPVRLVASVPNRNNQTPSGKVRAEHCVRIYIHNTLVIYTHTHTPSRTAECGDIAQTFVVSNTRPKQTIIECTRTHTRQRTSQHGTERRRTEPAGASSISNIGAQPNPVTSRRTHHRTNEHPNERKCGQPH